MKCRQMRSRIPYGDGDARWGTSAVSGKSEKKKGRWRQRWKRRERGTAVVEEAAAWRPGDWNGGGGDPAGPSIHLRRNRGRRTNEGGNGKALICEQILQDFGWLIILITRKGNYFCSE